MKAWRSASKATSHQPRESGGVETEMYITGNADTAKIESVLFCQYLVSLHSAAHIGPFRCCQHLFLCTYCITTGHIESENPSTVALFQSTPEVMSDGVYKRAPGATRSATATQSSSTLSISELRSAERTTKKLQILFDEKERIPPDPLSAYALSKYPLLDTICCVSLGGGKIAIRRFCDKMEAATYICPR